MSFDLDLDARAKKFDKSRQQSSQLKKRTTTSSNALKEAQRIQAETEIKLKNDKFRIEELRELEERLSDGIQFSCILTPYFIDGEDDKVILPPSALDKLNRQQALDPNIPISLRLSLNTIVTHAGVREFSAEEGTIGLPPRVRYSLCMPLLSQTFFQNSPNHSTNPTSAELDQIISTQLQPINVKFTRLPACTFLQLRPLSHHFHSYFSSLTSPDLVEEWKRQCLEDNLSTHITCTRNDLLIVWHRGNSFLLSVGSTGIEDELVHLGCRILNQDVSIQLDANIDDSSSSPPVVASSSSSSSLLNNVSTINSNSNSNLAPMEGSILISIKSPTGTVRRRFHRNSRISDLFAIVTQSSPVHYKLVTRSPRIEISSTSNSRISEIFNHEEEEVLLFVEVENK